jgi:hypothetical protein
MSSGSFGDVLFTLLLSNFISHAQKKIFVIADGISAGVIEDEAYCVNGNSEEDGYARACVGSEKSACEQRFC